MNNCAARLRLEKGDITFEKTDAVVNAANCRLAGGGGVDGAIHRAAGPALAAECAAIIKRIGRLETGKAVITAAGGMKSRFVIHTPGPVWKGGGAGEETLLRSCYRESLALALSSGLKTLAFPSISTGVYGYPTELAAPAALDEVLRFLNKNAGIELVRFVLYDEDTFMTYEKALKANVNTIA
ncbi:MAG: O-acetyl-ADP-ribose deacetylase [Elusimicrobia bacterium]|nr:O-acetyl-ADP-ribose deacetylase [Elusimicrobiota bacterium]